TAIPTMDRSTSASSIFGCPSDRWWPLSAPSASVRSRRTDVEAIRSDARQPRAVLNEAQLRSALGAELLSLCQTITKDGRLSDQEVAELRAWLAERESDDLPALVQLRATLDRVMDDGRITAAEKPERDR